MTTSLPFGRRLENPPFELKSVDAVVGVDVGVNSGSLEILEKRSDLLKISGLDPKAYYSCVSKGPESITTGEGNSEAKIRSLEKPLAKADAPEENYRKMGGS